MFEPDKHPLPEDLAVLTEQGPDAVAPEIIAHVAACPECQSAWAEAARYHGQILQEGLPPAAPVELTRQAKAWAAPPHRFGSRRRVFGWSAAAAAAAVLLVMLLAGSDWLSPAGRWQDAIQARLTTESMTGLVFPGADQPPADPQAVYRSGAEQSSELDTALGDLQARLQEKPTARQTAYWLAAGYLATDRLARARDITSSALEHHPDDVRLLQLEAIAAYRLSDLAAAEFALKQALAKAPDDPTLRFNLAVIRLETDRAAEATPVLRELAGQTANELIARRAGLLLP